MNENTVNKVQSVLNLFKQGYSVANPTAWKTGQISSTVLAGVILAAVNTASAFGVAIPITPEVANLVAAGIITAVNLVLTVVTTDKIGLKDDSAK